MKSMPSFELNHIIFLQLKQTISTYNKSLVYDTKGKETK